MSSGLAAWWAKQLLHAERKKWVMFEHGSVVIFTDRPDDQNATLVEDATAIMQQDGPVYVGTCHGDFNTITLDDGYVVTSHNPNLLTVQEGLVEGANDVGVGLLLRQKRHDDSQNPVVIATSIPEGK